MPARTSAITVLSKEYLEEFKALIADQEKGFRPRMSFPLADYILELPRKTGGIQPELKERGLWQERCLVLECPVGCGQKDV